jgi:hypothetical protein
MKTPKHLVLIFMIALYCTFILSACGVSEDEWRRELSQELNYSELFWMKNSATDQMYSSELMDIIEKDPKKIRELVYLTAKPTVNDMSIIAFYPSNATSTFVDILTACAKQDKLDLVDYGLSDPVTLDEVLNKREEVRRLYKDIHPYTIDDLWHLP